MQLTTQAFIAGQPQPIRQAIENIEWTTGVTLEGVWRARSEKERKAQEALVCALGMQNYSLRVIEAITKMHHKQAQAVLELRRRREFVPPMKTTNWEMFA